MIGQVVPPRRHVQFVTLVEHVHPHEAQEEFAAGGPVQDADEGVEDHPGRDDHGRDGRDPGRRRASQFECQHEAGGVDPPAVQGVGGKEEVETEEGDVHEERLRRQDFEEPGDAAGQHVQVDRPRGPPPALPSGRDQKHQIPDDSHGNVRGGTRQRHLQFPPERLGGAAQREPAQGPEDDPSHAPSQSLRDERVSELVHHDGEEEDRPVQRRDEQHVHRIRPGQAHGVDEFQQEEEEEGVVQRHRDAGDAGAEAHGGWGCHIGVLFYYY
mmetsp:Transcript_5925/g.13034  ORF Transcript_5925/g.13034 Transcript_5925/m.13034 type:complete len:269 (-) Transcript_5925:5-811(-)